MKTINIYILMIGALLFGIAGCAVTDIDRTVDFTKYKTFAWGKADIRVKNPAYHSDLINKNIKTTVKKELEKKGISYNPTNPDFLISYHTYTEKKQETWGGYYDYGYPFVPLRYYPFAYGFGFPFGWGIPPQMNTYTEGTLILDIIDYQTNEVVWRGSVQGNIDNVAALQKQIQKGIRAILKKYPASPIKESPLIEDDKIS